VRKSNKANELDIDVIISKNREQLVSQIYDAMLDLHDSMSKRIFTDLKDKDGRPPTAYDTKPLWVSKANYPSGVRDAGKKSKSGKTRYFASGYSQFKSEIGRPPLQLSGELERDFDTGLRSGVPNGVKKVSDLEYHFVLDSENKDKVDGNFKRFFYPSDAEMDELKKNLGGK